MIFKRKKESEDNKETDNKQILKDEISKEYIDFDFLNTHYQKKIFVDTLERNNEIDLRLYPFLYNSYNNTYEGFDNGLYKNEILIRPSILISECLLNPSNHSYRTFKYFNEIFPSKRYTTDKPTPHNIILDKDILSEIIREFKTNYPLNNDDFEYKLSLPNQRFPKKSDFNDNIDFWIEGHLLKYKEYGEDQKEIDIKDKFSVKIGKEYVVIHKEPKYVLFLNNLFCLEELLNISLEYKLDLKMDFLSC